MAYYGGAGITGIVHPSLRAYIDCFDSKPFPKAFPRGGGVWEQDPYLMLHFRAIREYEVNWRNSQAELQSQQSSGETGVDQPAVGGQGLESALDSYIESLEEDDMF